MELNKELLNGLLKQASESERLRAAYDLRTSNNDGSQRMLNALQPGTIVPIHRHPTTVETVIIVKGAVTEVYFDNEGKETNRIVLDAARVVMVCRFRLVNGTPWKWQSLVLFWK